MAIRPSIDTDAVDIFVFIMMPLILVSAAKIEIIFENTK